jgi:hypothetical protein
MTATETVPPSAPRRFPVRRLVSLVLLLAGLGIAAFGLFSSCQPDAATADEVFLDPATAPPRDPFVPSGATPPAPAPAPNLPPPPVPAPSGQTGTRSVPGTAPGLYGGSENAALCNTEQIARFLETSSDRAAPWAQVLGIAPTQIRAFLTGLTSVVLRTDTRVTSYGFARGRAVPTQAVLQAGTAVLVDPSGLPRVRCGSGNPLDRPRAVAQRGSDGGPRYAGTPWPGFVPSAVIVIVPTTPIGSIILVDLTRGVIIIRQPGIVIVDLIIPTLPPLLRPGDPVVITGRLFPPGTLVTITYDNPALTLGTVTADGAGNVNTTVAIPAASTVGLHQVTAAGGGVSNVLLVYVLRA